MAAESDGVTLDQMMTAMLQQQQHHQMSTNSASDYLVRRVSVAELVNNCMKSVLQQGLIFTLPMLIMCFLFKVLCHTVGEGFEETGMSFLPRQVIHISSGCLGLVILHHLFQEYTFLVLLQGLLAYVVLHSSKVTKWPRACGFFIILLCFTFHLTCQSFMSAEDWNKIRGPLMVLSLKVISVGFDLDHSYLVLVPGVFEFFGYIFNVGTVVFGPWISFLDYMTIIQIKERPMSINWVFSSLRAYVLSIFCLLYSTCFANWIIIDGSHKWLVAFRDAQSFRFSHYFTCFTSEATALASGIGSSRSKESNEMRWDLRVSRSLRIEIPRSLVEVVTFWNLPIHRFLKQYVFQQFLEFGTFWAILATYLASAMLHGFNFQLAAVLLSIGIYSYIEHVLRRRLADIFHLCIEARPCRLNHDGFCSKHHVTFSSTNHNNSSGSRRDRSSSRHHTPAANSEHIQSARRIWTERLTNAAFTCLALLHLTYLGLLFDTSPTSEQGYNYRHTIKKWADLDFVSHIIAALSYIFYKLIS